MPETVTVERVKHRSTHAVIDSIQLPEASVVGFLKGELRAGEVAKAWRSQVWVSVRVRVRVRFRVRGYDLDLAVNHTMAAEGHYNRNQPGSTIEVGGR